MVHRDRQIASGIPASCQHRTEAGCDCDPSESVRAFQLSAGRPNLLPYGSVVVTCASCTYLLVTIYSSSTANSHTAGMRGRRCACATPPLTLKAGGGGATGARAPLLMLSRVIAQSSQECVRCAAAWHPSVCRTDFGRQFFRSALLPWYFILARNHTGKEGGSYTMYVREDMDATIDDILWLK